MACSVAEAAMLKWRQALVSPTMTLPTFRGRKRIIQHSINTSLLTGLNPKSSIVFKTGTNQENDHAQIVQIVRFQTELFQLLFFKLFSAHNNGA